MLSKAKNMKDVLGLVALASALVVLSQMTSEVEASPMPIKFMCDMCESNWLGCVFKCNMEEYMTRHSYNGHKVYMGQPKVKPKMNALDHMFHNMMHNTGHDSVKRR